MAVLGVMLYHGGAPMAGGGFLGVDVFFVLSGFLITSLLLGEWTRTLTVKLGQFWARRARRLLPALLVMLVGVAIFVKVFSGPGEFAGLRLDSLSTLFYVANWHFIVAGGNYFDATAQPSPLQHMWTLSIEEQFYIVWPPVVLLLLHFGRKLRPARRLWPVLAVAVAGAVASAVDMRLSFQGGASVMRLYEGTDTRSQDILVGAALAIGMAMWAQRRTSLPGAQADRRRPGPGGTGPSRRRDGRYLPGTTAPPRPPPPARPRHQAHHRLGDHARAGPGRPAGGRLAGRGGRRGRRVAGDGPRGVPVRRGLLPVRPRRGRWSSSAWSPPRGHSLSRSLGNPVFRYVGKISYGTYLWHVPLFALFSAQRLHLYGYPLLAVRIGRHPGGGHGLLLPGGGADPPPEDPDLHRVAGLAA